MALIMDTDIVLDALCLAVYSDTDESKFILQQIADMYNETKKKISSSDKDLDIFFEIINDAIRNGVDPTKKSEKSQIILKIKKSDLGKSDKSIVDSVVDILSEDPVTIKKTKILTLQKRLQQWIFVNKSKDVARKISMKCASFNTSDDTINDAVISEVLDYAGQISSMEEHMVGSSETIDVVDMSNPKSVSQALSAFNKKRSEGVLKTGLKQLNRMLCPNNGFLRGEFAAFAASSHNYKSGMLMKCARWFCTKSDVVVPSGQTPCVVFVSLENEMPENTVDMLKEAYIDIYRQPIPEDTKPEDLIQKITEYYSAKNIKLLMYRFDENFTFFDFVKLMNGLKQKSYCVIATVIDYITLMQLEGDDRDNQAKRLQRLGEHFKNYAKRNNMLIVTGLQLNGLADDLNASGRTNVVRLYRPLHLSDCKGLMAELDILIFLRIEENQDGVPYLTGAWHKHRNGDRPSKENQYFAYRFHPILGLPEDEGTKYEFNKSDIYSDDTMDTAGDETSDLFGAVTQTAQPTQQYTFG